MANEIKLEVSDQLLSDLLCTALEQGSRYWAMPADSDSAEESEDGLIPTSFVIEDVEAKEAKTYTVDAATMLLGLQRLAERMSKPGAEAWSLKSEGAGRILTEALTENGDAGTADVVLQMGLFGEVLYG